MNTRNPGDRAADEVQAKIQRTLVKTYIALPLLKQMAAAASGTDFDVIIDANLDYPGARAAAQEWILETLGYLQQRMAADQASGYPGLAAGLALPFTSESAEDLKNPNYWVPRAIYEIWEDFKVYPQIVKTIATCKADAARAAFRASGQHICWAVIDSGIDQTHPHFAQHKNLQGTHAQWHRDFNDEVSDPAQSALRDEYGHGTHVASIRLKDSDSACEEFVKLARSLVRAGQPDRMDGSDRFFSDPPLKVFQHLGKPVSFTATALPGDRSDSAAGRGGSGLGLGDLFSGVGSAARNVLNLITFYQMKERAGVIGASALNPILRGIRRDHPALRLHLVGHSFGGRLVSATAAGTSANTLLQAESMSLLQAAFSHYGFARNWDQKNNDGVFRRVVEKKAIRHPLIITHTTSDQAVGMAYPLTS